MPVGVTAAAAAIALPRSRTSTIACSAVITRAPAAAAISPTLWPATAPICSKASAGCGNSSRAATRPVATSSGWAIRVSRIVVGVGLGAVVGEVEAGDGGEPVEARGERRVLEPGLEEAGSLGTLAGSDDDEHDLHSAANGGPDLASGPHENRPRDSL